MTDRQTLLRWTFWFGLAGLAVTVLFARLLPLDLTPGRVPGPDILLGVTFAWVLRRPDYVPIALVATLFFVVDMVLQRVPGISTLMVVVAVEFLRRRESALRGQHFVVEWGFVTAVLLSMVLGERMVLSVFFVEQIPFGRDLLQFLTTAAFYPVIVFLSVFALGVVKLQPGDDPAKGQAI